MNYIYRRKLRNLKKNQELKIKMKNVEIIISS